VDTRPTVGTLNFGPNGFQTFKGLLMAQVSSCPRCAGNVTLPADAGRADWVRCPLCSEKFLLKDILDRLPPPLIVLPHASAEPESFGAMAKGAMLAGGSELLSDNVDELLAEPFESIPPPTMKQVPPDLAETISVDLDDLPSALEETISLRLPGSDTHGASLEAEQDEEDELESLDFPEELSLASSESNDAFTQPSEADLNFVEELEQEPERTEFHDENEPFDPDSFLGETPFVPPHTKADAHHSDEALDLPLEEHDEGEVMHFGEEFAAEPPAEEDDHFAELPPPKATKKVAAAAIGAAAGLAATAGIPKAVPARKKGGGLAGKLIAGTLAGIIVLLGSSYALLWLAGKDADFCQLHTFLPGFLCPPEKPKPVIVGAVPMQPLAAEEVPSPPVPVASNNLAQPLDSGSPEPPAEDVAAVPANTLPAEPATPPVNPFPPAEEVATTPVPELPPADAAPTNVAPPEPGNTLTIVNPTPEPPMEESTPPPKEAVAGPVDALPEKSATMPDEVAPPADNSLPGTDPIFGEPSVPTPPAEPAGPLAPAPYRASAVAKVLAEVTHNQAQFEKIASLPSDEAKKVRADYFVSLFKLADAAAFSTPEAGPEADDQKPLVAAVIEKAAADDAKRSVLGRAAQAWLGITKEKRKDRYGVFVTGKVMGMEKQGGLYVAHIQLAGTEKTVDLLADKPFLFEGGDTVASLARLYENPAEQISGYQGTAELGVWDHLSVKLP
jgi:hypothetical protein